MNRNLITSAKFVVLAFMLLVPTFVHADKIPWVEWQSSSKTLTFRYDEAMDTTTASGKYTIPSDTRNTPEWTDFHFGIAKDVEKVVFAESFADARPTCSRGWFDGMSKITNIECIENLNTSEVKEMQSMFADCSSLTSVDLSHFDTGKVEDMWMMFYNCGALESIDISNFKTDSLRSMNCMFEGCTSLSSIILPKAENLKLKNLTGLFARCLLAITVPAVATPQTGAMPYWMLATRVSGVAFISAPLTVTLLMVAPSVKPNKPLAAALRSTRPEMVWFCPLNFPLYCL